MNGHTPPKVLVLYKITNVKGEGSAYNAFELPAHEKVSLGDVKAHCHALSKLNPSGSNGYQWRVRVDDKVSKGSAPKYSWWDIQDEHARLPVKEVSFTELSQIFATPKRGSASDDGSVKSSSVTRSLGKALNKVAASVEGGSVPAHHQNFPRVPIVVFKLLDIAKLHNEFSSSHRIPAPSVVRSSRPAARRPAPVPVAAPALARQAAPRRTAQAPVPAARANTRQAPAARRPAAQTKVQEGSLMDFGASAPTPQPMPVRKAAPTQTRAQKLKREYEQKNQNENTKRT